MLEAKRILVVDDEDIPRRFACAVLRGDYQVAEVASAEAALRALSDARFDLLITDCEMTGMTGIELVGHVMRRHPDLPCIVLSAGLNPERQRWLDAVGVPYLPKPYHVAELRELVRRALSDGSGLPPPRDGKK